MSKPFLLAIRGKVISAFLLAFAAIILALIVTYFSFNELLKTVDQLSSPNEKLTALHNLFQQITQLDHEQRAEAIKNPHKPYVDFSKESKVILLTIDTLREMDWRDKRQVERLNKMEDILNARSRLFLSYLKLKSNSIYNRKYTEKLDTLTRMLSGIPTSADTNVTTTKKKTTVTTYLPPSPEKENRSVLSRLFGKKKQPVAGNTRVEVKEELSVQVDTVSIAQQDSAYIEVGRIMKNLQQDQHSQNRKMLQRELELINMNTVLSNQLLGILHDVEKEELSLMRKNNTEASTLVNTSIQRIGIIIIIFLLGTAFLAFFILTDVAKSNYYKEQLVDAKEKAEELSQVKQRFLANMSHEIRTPLQSIVGYVEQLKESNTSNVEALSAIHSSSDHLLHIVNEILDYSRIESGKLTLTREPFNLEDLIKEVSSGIRIQAAHRNLTFSVETKGNCNVFLLGDAFRLRQVLYNVLGNAIKFTEKGFVKFEVETNASLSIVKCTFRIIDSGIGMDSAAMNKIFQQFERADGLSSHYGGSGLGLTIVNALVEAQRGSLDVQSVLNVGSTFTVLLDFDVASKADFASLAKINKVENQLPFFKGKILVVDDDPLILRLTSLILEKNKIAFVTFNDPEKVLEHQLDSEIALVLLDIRMPKVNGIELCKQLKKKLKTGSRIVALTAHVLPEEHAALLENGFDEVLTKPFKENKLLEIIGHAAVLGEAIPGQSLLDLSLIRKMTMGDEALFQSILVQFIEETENDITVLEENLNHMELKAVREVVHKLAGRTAQLGAKKISLKLRDIEFELDKGSNNKSLIENIRSASDEIKNLIKEVEEIVA